MIYDLVMTLEQLKIFLAVAEAQHVTRASRTLNLTQSAVSASIAALQSRYNVSLFVRVGRRIELTEAGRHFVAEARAVLVRAETAALVLEDFAREPHGRLRIFASQTVASYWLPARLITLRNTHPGIKANLTVGNTAQVADSVKEGAADLGLIEGEISEPQLHQEVVAHDELVMVTAPDHQWRGRRRVSPSQFRRHAWIMREPGSGTRSAFLHFLEESGHLLSDLTVAMELPSNEAILAAVAASDCVSILSRRAAEFAAASGRICLVQIGRAERPFSVLTRPGGRRTRTMEIMLEILKSSR